MLIFWNVSGCTAIPTTMVGRRTECVPLCTNQPGLARQVSSRNSESVTHRLNSGIHRFTPAKYNFIADSAFDPRVRARQVANPLGDCQASSVISKSTPWIHKMCGDFTALILESATIIIWTRRRLLPARPNVRAYPRVSLIFSVLEPIISRRNSANSSLPLYIRFGASHQIFSARQVHGLAVHFRPGLRLQHVPLMARIYLFQSQFNPSVLPGSAIMKARMASWYSAYLALIFGRIFGLSSGLYFGVGKPPSGHRPFAPYMPRKFRHVHHVIRFDFLVKSSPDRFTR